jgi:hypothetical protein
MAVEWFNSARGTVGIVMADDEREGVRFFIGPADGLNEQIDINNIMTWGARFPDGAGKAMFGVKDKK